MSFPVTFPALPPPLPGAAADGMAGPMTGGLPVPPPLPWSSVIPGAEADAGAGAAVVVMPVAAPRRGFLAGLASALDWLFGFVALIALLAACSVVPVLNFLSLGYLLHVSGTVARTGRLRDGFIGVRKASVIGTVAAGAWLVVWPARLVAGFWRDAELVAPGSAVARAWHAGLIALMVVTLLHLLWAGIRGGRLWHFLWPQPLRLLRWLGRRERPGHLQRMLADYVLGLRLPFYFWLGVRGFIGALAWLIVPVGILMAATRLPVGGSVLLSLVGGFLLLVVAVHLPFLQAHFAERDSLRAMFDLRGVRRLFARAPLAFWTALLVTLLFAVPLYLLKVELTPRELAWLPSVLFVLFIFPARLLSGWALARAQRREAPRHWLLRWIARLGILPVALVYVLVVYFTPYFSWNGILSLLEQHAFLVPAPLMAL